MLESQVVACPYCGESFEAAIDFSAGSQRYIEDCYVCCRPIQFSIDVSVNGELNGVTLMRDDE